MTLGVCTEQYGVVKNADLIEMVETNLSTHGKLSKFNSNKFVVRDGSRFYASYDFPDFKSELKPVGKRAKGDILGLRLIVNNSYDRSCRVSLTLGFLRLVCENGMTSLTKEFSMSKRHTLAVNLDFVGDALAHACDSVESSAQVFNKLAQRALTNEQGLNLLTKLEEKDIISGKVREGIEAVWARHARLARTVWAAFEAWERPGGVRLNVRDREHRSHAVTAIELPGHGTRLREWTEQHAGLTLGIGIGMAPPDSPRWHDFFRVGHMGHLSAHSLLGTLGCVGAGLKALGVPHGDGGLDAAAAVVAEG
jgi:hypothetical protein